MSLFEQIEKREEEGRASRPEDDAREEDLFVDALAEKLAGLSCSGTEQRVYPSFVRKREGVPEDGSCLYADNNESEILLDRHMVPIPSRGRVWMNAMREELQADVMAGVLSDPLLSFSLVIYTPALLMLMTGAPPKHNLVALGYKQKCTLDELDELDARTDARAAALRNFGQQRLGHLEADMLAEALRFQRLRDTCKAWPRCITASDAAIEYHTLIRTLIENNGFYARHTLEGMTVRKVIEDANDQLAHELRMLLGDKQLRDVVSPFVRQLQRTMNLRSLDDPLEKYEGTMPFGPALLAEVQHSMVDYTLNLLRALERWILRVAAPHALVSRIKRDAYEQRVMPYFFTEFQIFPRQPRPGADDHPEQARLLREIETGLDRTLECRLAALPGVWDASPRFLAPAVALDNAPRQGGRAQLTTQERHLPMPTMNFEQTARQLYAIANHLVLETDAKPLDALSSRLFWGNPALPFATVCAPRATIAGEMAVECHGGRLVEWVDLRTGAPVAWEHARRHFRQVPKLYIQAKIAQDPAASLSEKFRYLTAVVRHREGSEVPAGSDKLSRMIEGGRREEVELALRAFSLAHGL